MKFEEIIKILDNRLEKLQEEENRDRINDLDNERKRHPAFKQLKGRVNEVKYLKKLIKKEFKK